MVDLVVPWLFALTQIGPCHEVLALCPPVAIPFPDGAGPRHMASKLMVMLVQPSTWYLLLDRRIALSLRSPQTICIDS